jgi:O-antigen/teichoic acid export membrane protein
VNATLIQVVTEKTAKQASERRPSDAVANEIKRLLQHSSHYLTGILISLALGFVSFPIFTRAFSLSDYGTIELIAKVLLLFTALSKMGLQQAALRFYDGPAFVSDRASARRYYSTMFGGMVLTATFVTLIFLGGVTLAPSSLIGPTLKTLLFLVSALIVARALTSVLFVFVRTQEKARLYSVFTVSTKVASVAVICLFLPWFGRSVRTFYSGTILVETAVVIVLCSMLLQREKLTLEGFDLTLFRNGLAFGLPLIFYELASITLDAGDRVLVRHYLGADAMGRYSVAYGMSDYVNNLLIVPLNLALAPIYLRLWKSDGQEKTSAFLSRTLDLYLMASLGIFAVAAATSRSAVLLLASSKYRGAELLIPTLVAGLLVYTSHMFITAGLIIHNDTRTMARLLAYSALFNIGLNCFLLPRIGLWAAALVTLLSYLLCVVLLGRASFKVLPLTIDGRAAGKYVLAAAIAWYAAVHVNIESPFLNLAGRMTLTVLLYVGLLYIFDARIRALLGGFFDRSRDPRNFEEKVLAATSESKA